MTIKFKNITIKNFLSVGNVTQSVNLDTSDLTLIMGENLDLGGNGARNGVGKTLLVQALAYALFGSAINNIRKDNLINRTNGKQMLVTLDFSINSVEYRIERGRKPNILKFYVGGREAISNENDTSQGESKETQAEIERLLNLSPDMFTNIVALNTYTQPFLSMKASDQRAIIEQLLGITILSERAERLKEQIKENKASLSQEELRIKVIQESNQRVNEQIDSLKRRQKLWLDKKQSDLARLVEEYSKLVIDYDAELANHTEKQKWLKNKELVDRRNSVLTKQLVWKKQQQASVATIQQNIDSLGKIDIDLELESHKQLTTYNQLSKEYLNWSSKVKQLKIDIQREQKNHAKMENDVRTLREHRCYACGQNFHDEQHTSVLNKKEQELQESSEQLNGYNTELQALEAMPVIVPAKPVTIYKTESEAIQHQHRLANLQEQLVSKMNEVDPYADQLQEIPEIDLGPEPQTIFSSEAEAIKNQNRMSTLGEQILNKDKEVDPYADQIQEMNSTVLQSIDYEKVNNLNKLIDHQKFLQELLTNKDSFVRKHIIDQNLSYLNNRMSEYLNAIGLPHQVVFQNDLSVEISEFGRELDYDNLSRGESNRVILALSFAFRDVYENLFHSINSLFIDELIDSGMDTVGVENSLGILKDMSYHQRRGIWLVSHKEELINRVPNVLRVVKSGGFTSYSS